MSVRNQMTQLAKRYNNTLCHNPPLHAVVSLLVVKQEIILVELAADLYCLHQQDLYKTCIAFKITSTNLFCFHHCTCTPCRGTGYTPTPDLYCLHHQPRGLTTRIARPPPLACPSFPSLPLSASVWSHPPSEHDEQDEYRVKWDVITPADHDAAPSHVFKVKVVNSRRVSPLSIVRPSKK